MRNRGFTLIELIVVISVIAVLAGIILPTLGAIIDDARQARSITEVKHIATACLQYEKERGYLPYNGFGNLDNATATTQAQMISWNNACVKYVSRRIILDPFGTPYRYTHRLGYANFRAVAACGGKNKSFAGVWTTNIWSNRTEPAANQYGYYMVFK